MLVLNRSIPDLAFVWKDGRRTIFAPFPTPKEWERHVKQARERCEMAHLVQLPSTALDKIAELISQEG